MEQEDYLEHALQVVASNYQNKVAVAQTWQDKLMESIKDDEDSGALINAMVKLFDYNELKDMGVFSERYHRPIKLSNPKKLSRDYALLSGDSVRVVFIKETESKYHYYFQMIAKPHNMGGFLIHKEKLDGKVNVEFHFKNGWSESRSYKMDEFADFNKFMKSVIEVIIKT